MARTGAVAGRSLRFPTIPTSTSVGLVLIALAAITALAVIIDVQTRVSVAAVGWLYLLIILPVTLRWRRAAGLATAGVAAFLLITFLTEPRGLPYTRNGIDLIRLLLSTGCVAVAVLLVRPADREHAGRERILAEIVSSTDDAAFSMALDGTVTNWSAGAERLYGYSARQVGGRPAANLSPPNRSDELTPTLERFERGERSLQYETGGLALDGHVLDVALTISPIRDAGGALSGASVVAHDITARKRVEQAFRAGDDVLVGAIENLVEGLLILDRNGRVLAVQ